MYVSFMGVETGVLSRSEWTEVLDLFGHFEKMDEGRFA